MVRVADTAWTVLHRPSWLQRGVITASTSKSLLRRIDMHSTRPDSVSVVHPSFPREAARIVLLLRPGGAALLLSAMAASKHAYTEPLLS